MTSTEARPLRPDGGYSFAYGPGANRACWTRPSGRPARGEKGPAQDTAPPGGCKERDMGDQRLKLKPPRRRNQQRVKRCTLADKLGALLSCVHSTASGSWSALVIQPKGWNRIGARK